MSFEDIFKLIGAFVLGGMLIYSAVSEGKIIGDDKDLSHQDK